MSQSNQRQKLSVKRIERLRTRCIPYTAAELELMKARAKAKREGLRPVVFNDPRQGDEKPGRHLDEKGLFLQVRGPDNCSWQFKYVLAGKSYTIGLGPLSAVSLDEARTARDRLRNQLAKGLNPSEERKREGEERAETARERAAKSVTFEQIAQKWWERNRDAKTWKSERDTTNRLGLLKNHAYPILGKMIVGTITKHHIVRVLEQPHIKDLKDQDRRVRQTIKAVLAYAYDLGLRDGPNPASKETLGSLLVQKSKVQQKKEKKERHHTWLEWERIADFVTDLRTRKGPSAMALQFLILTAARTGEVIGAKWSEIDLDKAVWTVPAGRMKAGLEHRVPLSAEAMAILKSKDLIRYKDNPFVFVGDRKAGMSNMAMLQLLKRMGNPTNKDGKPVTVHGFRATFRDWVAEDTRHNYPRDLAETALAHVLGEVEGSYQHGDRLEKRREMMQAWANHCGGKAQGSNVVPLHPAKTAAE